jgi:hypothetical protein
MSGGHKGPVDHQVSALEMLWARRKSGPSEASSFDTKTLALKYLVLVIASSASSRVSNGSETCRMSGGHIGPNDHQVSALEMLWARRKSGPSEASSFDTKTPALKYLVTVVASSASSRVSNGAETS